MQADKARVAAVKVADYHETSVARGVAAALDLLGGIGKFVQAGDKVLLKPNMLEGLPSECAVTTHPEVVRAMIRQVKAAGATPLVGDSPGVTGTLKAAEKCGMLAMCAAEGTELVPFEGSAEFPFPAGQTVKKFHLAQVLQQVDKVISIAKLKTHTFMGMTGATKNMFGCIVGMQKAQFHLRTQKRRDFAGMLTDLALLVRPVLSVVDGVVGMEGNGPRNGSPKNAGLLLAGENSFAVDMAMAGCMGFSPETIPLLALALERGLTPPPAGLELVGDASSLRHQFLPPRSMLSLEDRLPGWLVKWCRSQLTAKPAIGAECIGCGRCARHCPPQAINVESARAVIDDSRCIRCYCCQELCPANAVQLQEGLALKLTRRWLLKSRP